MSLFLVESSRSWSWLIRVVRPGAWGGHGMDKVAMAKHITAWHAS